MERLANHDIASSGWKPDILPLNYNRKKLEEQVGFEPTDRLPSTNSFQDCPNKPCSSTVPYNGRE